MADPSTRQVFLDIVDSDYAVPKGVDPAEFILAALPLLGEPDGEFRERCVYGTLHRWVIGGAIDDDGLRAIHNALLGESALFSGIGETESDSVFLRAFAVLMLVPTLYMHRQRPLLSAEDVDRTGTALTRYLLEEKDLRGYVSEEKWWAHAIAHAADAVGQVVLCSELGDESLRHLLHAIAHAMTPDSAVYAHEEDARMATAVMRLLKRDILPPDAVTAWLEHVVPHARFRGPLPGTHIRYVNARNFVRCLYFQAKEDGLSAQTASLIAAAHDAFPDR
jgi:hypothetical protein